MDEISKIGRVGIIIFGIALIFGSANVYGQNNAPEVSSPLADENLNEYFSTTDIDLAGVFTDPDGDNLTYSVSSSDPTVVSAAIDGLTLTLTEAGIGTSDVTVTATDDSDLGALSTDNVFTVTVTDINGAPEVSSPLADENLNEYFSTTDIDLASVFTDPDGDNLTYSVSSSDPTVVAAAIDGLTLTLTEAGVGTSDITVTATDDSDLGALSTDDVFTVTVTDINGAPEVTSPLTDENLNEYFSTTDIDLTGVFTDPDGDNLTYSVSSSDPTVVSAAIDGLTLTLTEAGIGTSDVTVTATDDSELGILSTDDVFTVTVTDINGAPEVSSPLADDNLDEYFSTKDIDLTGVFTDPDGDNLTYSVSSSDPTVVTAAIDGLTLTLTEAGIGTSDVTVTATDDSELGILSTDDVFTVTVTDINGAPEVILPLADENLDEYFSTTDIDLTGVFTDPDEDNLTYSVSSSDPTVVTAAIDGLTLTLTEAGIGTSDVTVTATDDSELGILSTDDVFTVTVTDINGAPEVSSPLADDNLDEYFSTKDIDLTGVFTDPDGDNLTYSVSSSDPTVVTAAIDGLTLTLTEAGIGTSDVTVTATDDSELGILSTDDVFTVTVTDINGAPEVILPLADENLDEYFSTTDIDLTGVFTDPDEDNLTYSVSSSDPTVVTAAIDGLTLTLTEAGIGTSDVTVTATDDSELGILSTDDVFTVTVTDINGAPEVILPLADENLDEYFSTTDIDLTGVFTDPDEDNLTYSVSSSDPTVVTAAIDGLTLTLTEAGIGTSDVTVTATDDSELGILSTDDVFTVTVTDINGAPEVISPLADENLDEYFSTTDIDLTGVFTDPDEDNLTYSVSSSDPTVVTAAIDGLTLTLTEAGIGTSDVTVTATDDSELGILSTDDVFTVTVTDINGAPEVSSPLADENLDEYFSTTDIDLTGVFTDPDEDNLTYSVSSSDPTVVTAAIDGLTLTLTEAGIGTSDVTVTATDDSELGILSTDDVFTVTVTDINGAPEVSSPLADQDFNEGFSTTSLDISNVFSDPDGDNLSYSVVVDDVNVVTAEVVGNELNISEVGTGATLIALTATDDGAGTLSATNEFTVTIDEIPVITDCADDRIVSTDINCEAAVPDFTGDITATDDGTIVSTTQSPAANSTIGPGVTVVTITVTDDAGNTASCEINLTVVDDVDPVPDIADLPDILSECEVSELTIPTASDNCSGTIQATSDVTLPITVQGTTQITWTYTDASGNITTQTQNVVIDDVTAPVPDQTTLPDITGECEATAVPPTATDACVGIITGTTSDPLSYTDQGTYTITWIFNDGNGNEVSQEQTVIISDSSDPSLEVPADIVVSADPGACSATNVTIGTPVVSDNCEVADVTNDSSEPYQVGINTITWTVTDGAGNTTTGIQTITVLDEENPVITTCAENKTQIADINGESTVPDLTSEIIASDNCDSELTISQSPTAGATIGIGITRVTITLEDDFGNTVTCESTVTVADENSPAITSCADDLTIAVNEDCEAVVPDLTGDVTATDDGSIASITQSPLAGTSVGLGVTPVIITVTDDAGNSATCSANITVIDNTDPVPEVLSLPDITAECEVTELIAPTATDNCAGIITASSNTLLPINTQGTTVVTWTYDDGNGNIVTQNQNIVIDDISPADIAAPADITISSNPGVCYATEFSAGDPVVSDNCDLLDVTSDLVDTLYVGENLITWTVVDKGGNVSEDTQLIIVQDNESPEIISCANDMQLLTDATGLTTIPNLTGNITAIDNCDDNLTITQSPPPGTEVGIGATSVFLSVEDNAGNSSFCEVNLEVLYDTPSTWVTNPSNYFYNGQVTAKVFIEGIEVENGTLAAFVGEECRGITDALYFSVADHFVFDMLVFSNTSSGEEISFKYFDNENNIVYDLEEIISFRPDMIIENAVSPFELNHYRKFIKTFVPGWNWFSFNSQPANSSINEALIAEFNEGDYIKSQTQSATYYDGSGWFGQLKELQQGKLYKAFFNDTVDVVINGFSIDIDTFQLDLVSGWNWIGFMPDQSQSINEALSSLQLTELDYIKSQRNSALFYEGFGWFGGLTNLHPGEGYMIQLKNPDKLQFNAASSAKKSVDGVNQQFSNDYVNPAEFEYNGTMTSVIKSVNSGQILGSEENQIFAYVDGICRGVANGKYFAPTQNYVYQFLLHSNIASGEEVNFKYYDTENEILYELNETIIFQNDMIEANAYEPFLFFVNDQVLESPIYNSNISPTINMYPNPFHVEINIEYSLDQNSYVNIEIYNLNGELLDIIMNDELSAGDYQHRWNPAGIPTGIFLIRSEINGLSQVRKVNYIN